MAVTSADILPTAVAVAKWAANPQKATPRIADPTDEIMSATAF
jgi:hypothetical protein